MFTRFSLAISDADGWIGQSWLISWVQLGCVGLIKSDPCPSLLSSNARRLDAVSSNMFACKTQEKPVTSYGSDEPRKDTYPPTYSSYDPPYDSAASSTQHAAPAYPPPTSYQPLDHSPSNTYTVDHPRGQYPPPTDTGSYPPKKDVYTPPTEHVHSHSSYKPSPPAKPYPPPPRDPLSSSYHDYVVRPIDYKRETGTGYSDKHDH